MASSNNNFLVVLATINVVGFIIILILFWLLWNNNSLQQGQNITVNYVPPQSEVLDNNSQTNKPQPSVNAEDISKITAVAKEVISNNLNTSERLDIKIPKPTETSANQNTANATPNNSKLSDQDYITYFDEYHSREKIEPKPVSKEDALTKTATKKTSTNDNFNKVDVSKSTIKNNKILTLAQQVTAAAQANSDELTKNAANNNGWKDYLGSLKEAESERQNEMRTITVKRGDTLWKISIRAYGTGYSYNKIFVANPHLTSPDSITVGEILRVPL